MDFEEITLKGDSRAGVHGLRRDNKAIAILSLSLRERLGEGQTGLQGQKLSSQGFALGKNAPKNDSPLGERNPKWPDFLD